MVIGMICLGSMLGQWMLRVRPFVPDPAITTVFETPRVPPAALRAPHSPPPVPPSFVSHPLAFLSRASADSLDLLPGIGPVTAARIISAREASHGFSSWQEVLDVKGIGPRMVARWQSLSTRQ
jgi:hypothetical protein